MEIFRRCREKSWAWVARWARNQVTGTYHPHSHSLCADVVFLKPHFAHLWRKQDASSNTGVRKLNGTGGIKSFWQKPHPGIMWSQDQEQLSCPKPRNKFPLRPVQRGGCSGSYSSLHAWTSCLGKQLLSLLDSLGCAISTFWRTVTGEGLVSVAVLLSYYLWGYTSHLSGNSQSSHFEDWNDWEQAPLWNGWWDHFLRLFSRETHVAQSELGPSSYYSPVPTPGR